MNNDTTLLDPSKLCVWGDNTYGQLACENKNNELKIFSPKLVTFGISIVEISCGFEHSLMRNIQGELYAVGNNNRGQLGIGKDIKRRTSPTVVSFTDPKERVLLNASNGYHNIIYTDFGKIYSWGENSSGQLGTGDFKTNYLPVCIDSSFHFDQEQSAITLSCGKDHSVLLLNNGKCWSWGSNSYGQLGFLSKSSRNTAKPTPIPLNEIQSISAGIDQTIFSNKKKEVFVCGNNEDGRLNQFSKKQHIYVPEKIPLEIKISRVFASNFNAALSESGEFVVWGKFLDKVYSPFTPTFLLGEQADSRISINDQPSTISIGLGFDFMVVVTAEGDIYVSGSNDCGQLANSNYEDQQLDSEYPVLSLVDVLSPFETQSVFCGSNFIFSLVKEKTEETEEGDLFRKNNLYIETEESFERAQNSINDQSPREDNNISNNPKQDLPTGPFIDMVKILVLLYDNLRFTLINIIDDNISIDKVLSPYLITFIQKQQDIIDSYIEQLNLKFDNEVEITPQNIDDFDFQASLKLLKEELGHDPRNLQEANTDLLNKNNKDQQKKDNYRDLLSSQKQVLERRINELEKFIKKTMPH